jgi:hypothetical protein
MEPTKQEGERRGKKPHTPESEAQEGMPHHQHCPLAKCREDRNPKYHEEQQKILHEFSEHIPMKKGQE